MHRVELGTAATVFVLGVGLGLALPEDQSMPYPYNRIITVSLLHDAALGQKTLG